MCEEARGLREENDSVFVLVYVSRCTERNKYCLYFLNSLRTFQKVRVYSHYLLRYQCQENCDMKIVCGTWTTMWQIFLRREYKNYCVFIGLQSVIRLYECALMMEAVGSCETSVRFYQATQCHVPEGTTLHLLHCGELLKTNGGCKWWISAIPRNESWAILFCKCALFPEHPSSVADISIRYGLNVSGFESRWGQVVVFSTRTYPSRRPASCTMGSGPLAKSQAPGAWRWGVPLLSLCLLCHVRGDLYYSFIFKII